MRIRVPLLFLLRSPNTNILKKTNPGFHSLFFKDRTVHVFHKRDVLHLHYNALKSLKYKTKESLVNILWYIVKKIIVYTRVCICVYDLYIREPFGGLYTYLDVFVCRVSQGITFKLTFLSPPYLNLYMSLKETHIPVRTSFIHQCYIVYIQCVVLFMQL